MDSKARDFDKRIADLEARIALRDRLLDAIIEHLKRRRGDGHQRLRELVQRIVRLVRANDDRIEESRLVDDIQAFAEMDTSRGKQKPFSPLRDAAISVATATGYLRSEIREHPRPSNEGWSEAIQGAWRDALTQRGPLAPKDLSWILRGGTTEDRARRLVFLATRPTRSKDESFTEFRVQLGRQKLRAHPWSPDTKS